MDTTTFKIVTGASMAVYFRIICEVRGFLKVFRRTSLTCLNTPAYFEQTMLDKEKLSAH